MRPIVRRALLGFALVVAALFALAAVPSTLGSGDPYYMTATPTDDGGPAVNATALPADRFPYLTAALESGRSDPYRTGPYGLKEAFTHSPFDEREALMARNPDAGRNGTVVVVDGDDRYLVEVTRR